MKNENNNTSTNSNNNNNDTSKNNNSSTSNNNNSNNSNTTSGAIQNSNASTTPYVNKILNEERFTYVLTCLVGNEVSVHMKDGNEIKGLFHAFNGTHNNDKKDIDIALNLARVISKKDKVSGPVNKAMLVQEKSYKMIVGKNVKLDLKDPDEANNTKDKFKIDTDISENKKNVTNANRELKKWIGDSDFDENKLKLENSSEPWDQFERNRKLYGVTTTYKEEIYTTNLDLNKIPHHVKMQADKIAKELEKRGMHLDPEDAERDNENVDEEDLFGAVRQVNNNHNVNNKDKYNKKYVKKEESNKSKPYQSKYHLAVNEENEKNQSSKKDSEKKFTTDAHQIVSYTPTGSNDDRNVGKKNKPVPTSNIPKRTNNRNAEFIGINALNLEPALPKLDEKTRTEWTLFKNQAKHKTNHKKDKTTEKQEFITAAREFNERMSNSKANLNKKEGNIRMSKDHSNNNQLPVMNQKGASNVHDKSKSYGNDFGKRMSKHINETDNKMGGNNSMLNFNSVHYNASAMMNNPNMRPFDFYFMNFNNFNMKNNMIPPNMGEFYQNIPIMHNAQNQIFPCANPHIFKNEGMPYPNMKMNEMISNDFYNPHAPFSKEHNNEDLSPFPSKRKKNRDKKSFKDFMNTALSHAKEEECVNAPIEFRCNHNYSYKNILGEIPKCAPMNPNFAHANNFSNNIGMHNNMGNIPVGFPYVPVVSHGMNGHYLENPLYFNPYVPNFHHHNNATAVGVPPIGVGPNQPYPFNIPPANIDGSYTSNKNMNMNMNMNMFPMRNNPGLPMHNPHMNIPIPTCVGPAMNYPMNSSSINMMNNPNVQNPNMNMPPYPPEMVLMNAQKYANSQSMHTPYMPQYQYQNCYTPSHGVN